MWQSPVKGLSKKNGPKLLENGNSVVVVDVDAVTVVTGVDAIPEIVDIDVVGVVAYNDEGSHISRNLLQPPGGGDSCSSDRGWKRRDWTNQEFISASRILEPLFSLSEEGSQTFSPDVSVVALSTELKLLFELKRKRVCIRTCRGLTTQLGLIIETSKD